MANKFTSLSPEQIDPAGPGSSGGPFAWWRRIRQARQRILAEDALKFIHDRGWSEQEATIELLADALRRSVRVTRALVEGMEACGWVRCTDQGLTLDRRGERLALQVIRAHRLWERYLVDEARMPVARVHREAERREHNHSAETMNALEAAMGHPTVDPHGDPIPTSDGELARLAAKPITDWPIKTAAQIVHLEDEPPAVFAQIAAMGLRPGQTISVTEADTERIVLFDGQESFVLAPIVAANIFVSQTEATEKSVPTRRLTTLRTGQSATVLGLDQDLQGFTRRRLLDLGITPGAAISAEMSSFARDPVAYRIRGSLIALRREQAKHVLITPNGN